VGGSLEREVLIRDVLFGLRHPPPANRRGVLFVHGFLGDPDQTWHASGSAVGFPELLFDDPGMRDYDVFVFRYQTGLIKAPTISEVVQQLGNAIESQLIGYQLVIVAHSLGGIVAMEYIIACLRLQKAIPVAGLVLCGTPAYGVEWLRVIRALSLLAAKAPWLATLLNFLLGNKQLARLRPVDETLQSLHFEWGRRVVNGGDREIPATGRSPVAVKLLSGVNDLITPQHSARVVYGSEWAPINTDHRGLVKPVSRHDDNYVQVARFLHRCRSTASPRALAHLRHLSDWVWGLSGAKPIRDWKFECHFHKADNQDAETARLEGFAPFEVRQCEYATVISGDPLTFGMTLGGQAAARAWRRNPLYLHQIMARAMTRRERAGIFNAIKDRLGKTEEAWRAFFSGVSARVRSLDTQEEWDLVPGSIDCDESSLLRSYEYPAEVRKLTGREAVLSIQFWSVVPRSLCSFGLAFPWWTDGFAADVAVHGVTEYVMCTPHIAGGTRPDIHPEEVGDFYRIRISTQEVVIPGSVIDVRWCLQAEGA
jgi:pimeloyl-ACP methyl ester carboxylesterase